MTQSEIEIMETKLLFRHGRSAVCILIKDT